MKKFMTVLAQKGMSLALLALLAACGGGGGGGGGGTAPPSPQADSFSWTGNSRLTVFAAAGLLANDPPGSVIASADSVSSQGGIVSVDTTTGAFVYDPPLGLQNASDTFTYEVAGALPTTVTITLAERIWYVRNNDPGSNLGSDRAPFLTLAQAEAAADADDTIFVFAGDLTAGGQDAGIALKDGQRLLGEGVGLKFNGVPLVDPVPNAVISNRALGPAAGAAPVVLLATGNEVAGFTIDAAFNEGLLATGGGGYDLHDNFITLNAAGGREGIRLLNAAGANRILRNTVIGAPRSGIRIANDEDRSGNNVAATPVTATVAIGGNSVSGSAGPGIAVRLDGAGTEVGLYLLTNTVAAAGASGIDVVSLGAADVMAVLSRNAVTSSGGAAVELAAEESSLLDLFVANSTLSLSGAGVDFRAATVVDSSAAACLELIENGNPATNATFSVANNGGGPFTLFESGNDTLASRAGTIVDAPAGSCDVLLEGALLFEVNCARCHTGNGLGQGNVGPDVTGATAAMINFQLVNNPTMAFIKLTSQEVAAIAAALAPVP